MKIIAIFRRESLQCGIHSHFPGEWGEGTLLSDSHDPSTVNLRLSFLRSILSHISVWYKHRVKASNCMRFSCTVNIIFNVNYVSQLDPLNFDDVKV